MNFIIFLSVLTWFVPIILCLGILIGSYFFRLLDLENRYLVAYIVNCFAIDLISRLMGKISENNLIFFILFSMVELSFFYLLYLKVLNVKGFLLHLLFFVSISYMGYEILCLDNANSLEFQSYSKSLCSFVILILTTLKLFDLLKDSSLMVGNLRFYSFVFIYYSVNLIFFLPFNFLINAPSLFKFYLWFLYLIITIVFYSFLVIKIWKNGVRQK